MVNHHSELPSPTLPMHIQRSTEHQCTKFFHIHIQVHAKCTGHSSTFVQIHPNKSFIRCLIWTNAMLWTCLNSTNYPIHNKDLLNTSAPDSFIRNSCSKYQSSSILQPYDVQMCPNKTVWQGACSRTNAILWTYLDSTNYPIHNKDLLNTSAPDSFIKNSCSKY